MARSKGIAALAGFTGGLALGLIVWSQQTHRYRRNLFSAHPLRRYAALGYVAGQHTSQNVRMLRDYVAWERHPGLRRRGELVLRRMERALA